MVYSKNLPVWERGVRLAGAAVMGLCALQFGGTPPGWAFGIMGAALAVTSISGFCPACAVAGRKLKVSQK